MLLGGLFILTMTGPALLDFLARLLVQQLGGEPWLTGDATFLIERVAGVDVPARPGALAALGAGDALVRAGPSAAGGPDVPARENAPRLFPPRPAARSAADALAAQFRPAWAGPVQDCDHRHRGVVRDLQASRRDSRPDRARRRPDLLVHLGPVLLDRRQDRPGAVDPGDHRLRLSMVAASAGPADDAAGSAGGNAQLAGRSANDRPAARRAAAVGTEPHFRGGAQGRRGRYEPHRAGHRLAVRRDDDGGADRGGQGSRHSRPAHSPFGPGKRRADRREKTARASLYRDVDVNHPVPNEMYAAVAEVLAYVYQLQGKTPINPNAAA